MILADFSKPEEVSRFSAIDDAVMGGRSFSQFCVDLAGHAVFKGTVSFDNNGGFASVRCQSADLGAAGAHAYQLEVMGDGKTYKFSLRIGSDFDGINYQCRFQPPANQWATVRLACTDFLPSWHGRPVADAPPFDPAHVRQMGFLIADQQEGRFSLSVRKISVQVQANSGDHSCRSN